MCLAILGMQVAWDLHNLLRGEQGEQYAICDGGLCSGVYLIYTNQSAADFHGE